MVAALLSIASAASLASAPAAVHAPDARGAVERALPSLQRSAKTFVATRSCGSCHHNILPILTLRLAASGGFKIETATLAEVERKTFRVLTNPRAFDDAVQGTTVSDPTPNDSWLLVAAKTAGLAPDVTRAIYAKRIASWQREGHWTTSDFRPPHSSSLFTATALRLLALARDSNTSDRDLESAVSSDPSLTFQLLRLVNSASSGGRGIQSIGHAIRLVGRSAFVKWLALAFAASRAGGSGVDNEIARQAVQRARMCEAIGGRDAGTLFLIGLFSLLDAMFRMPLADVLERINLAPEARDALLDRTGPFGDALNFVEAYELGLWEQATDLAKGLGVAPDRISAIYTDAVRWAAEQLSPNAAKAA